MLMGLIGFGSAPPAPPSSDDEPGPGPDDTGTRILSDARAATSRYRRRTSKVGRYAWAVSLGVHAIVLAGAFLALRYYFGTPAPKASADVDNPAGSGSIVQSQAESDLIRGLSGITFVKPDFTPDAEPWNPDLRSFAPREPQTARTLVDLTAVSGIEDWQIRKESTLTRFPGGPKAGRASATQSSPRR